MNEQHDKGISNLEEEEKHDRNDVEMLPIEEDL